MAQTATTLADVLKERWSDDQLVQQWETKAGPLKRIEAIKGKPIGKQLQVPIYKHQIGGYTSVGAGGGSLNSAGNAGVDQALYTLVYHWQPISIDSSALNQAAGDDLQAVVGAKNLEVKAALDTIRKQMVRQLVTNGDGVVAQCGTTAGVAEVELVASPSGTAWGYDALVRGWLQPGVVVDIGTAADSDADSAGGVISAVEKVAASPSITISGATITTTTSDFVTIANPNSTTARNTEMNGLRNIVSTTEALGGLDPQNAGEEFWSAAARDTSTTVFSLDLALTLDQAVKQESGETFSNVWTGYKQQRNFYSLLQNQVRFAGDMKLGAGNTGGVTWNGMQVEGFPDILDADWYCLTLSDFVRVHGAWTTPKWASDIAGQSGMPWEFNTTRFGDGLVYPMQIGTRRRNTQAGATGLTA